MNAPEIAVKTESKKRKEPENGDDSFLAPKRKICPYLDTVNRHVLDFDFEKLCSVSLSNLNVYACLVCGKYFQGRGRNSHAYFHSLQANHHVFINLHNEKVYCLPDGYSVEDSSLDDVKKVLNPSFTVEQVSKLDRDLSYSRALDGRTYLPGVVGLNNVKCTDYVNVVVQALAHVSPLRDFFLLPNKYQNCTSVLVQRFGELVRKMWNPLNFKDQVSPHELLQAISLGSKGLYRIGSQSDPSAFLSWFINTLHRDLVHASTNKSSIVHRVFQGDVDVTTYSAERVKPAPLAAAGHAAAPASELPPIDDATLAEILGEEYPPPPPPAPTHPKQPPQTNGVSAHSEAQHGPPKATSSASPAPQAPKVVVATERTPFLLLSLDLPPCPLFKDAQERNIIPQVPLFRLLEKFDSVKFTDMPSGERKQYALRRLPQFLILHIKRFTKNNFFVEKNNTIVNFPVKNLEMRDYVKGEVAAGVSTKYDLVCNIVHDGKPEDGRYRVHILHKANQQWYEVEDLNVRDTLPQIIALSEAFIQIYERQAYSAPRQQPLHSLPHPQPSEQAVPLNSQSASPSPRAPSPRHPAARPPPSSKRLKTRKKHRTAIQTAQEPVRAPSGASPSPPPS